MSQKTEEYIGQFRGFHRQECLLFIGQHSYKCSVLLFCNIIAMFSIGNVLKVEYYPINWQAKNIVKVGN